nr:unnamed protein product [Digitaria exilis]
MQRSVRDIAALYNCQASLEKVEECRRAEGFTSISSKCFRAANISAILIDDDMSFDKMLDMESHKAVAPVVVRILGIECLAETVLNDESFSGLIWTLESLTEAYIAKLKSYPPDFSITIAACRSGLDINPNVSKKDAEDGLRKELAGQKPLRITNKNLIDYLFTSSLEIAASLNLPVQIYTGSVDVDQDLGKCNPLHLRAVLDDERFAKSQLVLLHASYPFSKEASYLASVYSQVYLDFGLAIPKLSVHGMTCSLKELLDRAPIKKVMFSTDGYAFPDTYYLDIISYSTHLLKKSHFQVVPARRFYETTMDQGVGLPLAIMGLTSFSDHPAEGTNFTGVGEMRLVPDMSTICRLPWY